MSVPDLMHFFRRKNHLKLIPGMMLNFDYVDEEGHTLLFESRVKELQRRRLILAPPQGALANRITPGLKVRISTIQDETMFAYPGTLIDVNNQSMEASLPGNQMEDSPLPKPSADVRFELSMPVQYRALRTHHTQNGDATRLSGKGLWLLSRVVIPSHTELVVNCILPASDCKIELKGRSLTSSPQDKKFVTEVEFSDIAAADLRRLWEFAALQTFKTRSSRPH